MPKAKKTPQAKSGGAKAKKAAKKKTAAAAPKKAAKKTAAKKKAAKKKAAAAPKKKAAKKTAAAAAPKKAAKKTAAAPAPKKAAKKKTAAPEASTKQVAAPAPAPKKAAKKAVAAAPQPSGSDHDAAIARIEAKAAAAGVKLAEGASAKAIKAAEKTLGAALPEDVVAFYRRHDGVEDDDDAVEGRELLSLSRMVDEWKIWKDLLDQGTFEDNDHGLPDPGVQKKWWIAAWVPVTYDGAGNHHVIDLAPASGGTRGQILSFWHDDDPRTVVAKDFLTWLEGAHWGEGHEAGDREDASSGADDDVEDADDDEPDEAAGSERRFEMEQKFWAIRLDGDSFTVRYGKLGTEGQEQLKSFDDDATAQKEHDKLVAAKTKKGYREV